LADCAKRFCCSFHRVAPARSMHMQVNEPGCNEASREINDPFDGARRVFADLDDSSTFHSQGQAIGDSIRENQAAVGEDHWREHDCVYFRRSPSSTSMGPEFDVAILGGAFSGAATALLIKRRQPNARILIVEKATEFDRKVGESTTEVSSCFLTRI